MKTNTKQSTSAIYRTLILGILHALDDLTFGYLNAETLQESFLETILACKCK
jgi:hypothetical protein